LEARYAQVIFFGGDCCRFFFVYLSALVYAQTCLGIYNTP
jgi:hypothetical protein